MNTAVLHTERSPRSGVLAFVWSCWRRLDWRFWGAALLAGAVIAVISVLTMIEYVAKMGPVRLIVWTIVMPLVIAACVLLAWSIADGVGDGALRRPWRIALAVMVGAAVGVTVSMIYYEAAALAALLDSEWSMKGRTPPSFGVMFFAEWFNAVVNCALFVVAGEVWRSRLLIGRAAEAALREQAAMAREVLEARLAAMQAQVEPRFLFDSLVDIQKLYEQDAVRGAGTLDQLIRFLRVALPRLRESGSTLGAEIELVTAYVAVVAARHHGVPRIVTRVEPDCLAARCSPMLLLPLVQRAVRARDADADRGPLASSIELSARREGAKLVAELRFAAGGLCADDEDLARVRRRLAGLYAAGASLECTEPAPGTTVFTLRLPHESNHVHERSELGNDSPLVGVGADGGGR